MHTPVRERLFGGVGAAVIVVLIGYVLVFGLTMPTLGARLDRPMTLVDLLSPPPPPPKPHVELARSSAAKRAPSPRNLKNKATEVVVVPPLVPLSMPSPVVAAPRPDVDVAANTGASDRPGPGQGAGGQGNGTGGGGDGDDGGDVPPRQIRGHLKWADLPPEIREAGTGGTVGVSYDVGLDGRVGRCIITGSSGNADLDQLTCRLIQQRFRFEPGRDRDGRPFWSTIVEKHSWEIDRSDYPEQRR